MDAYISEPEIRREDVLKIDDGDFNLQNVCTVTGAGSAATTSAAASG